MKRWRIPFLVVALLLAAGSYRPVRVTVKSIWLGQRDKQSDANCDLNVTIDDGYDRTCTFGKAEAGKLEEKGSAAACRAR